MSFNSLKSEAEQDFCSSGRSPASLLVLSSTKQTTRGSWVPTRENKKRDKRCLFDYYFFFTVPRRDESRGRGEFLFFCAPQSCWHPHKHTTLRINCAFWKKKKNPKKNTRERKKTPLSLWQLVYCRALCDILTMSQRRCCCERELTPPTWSPSELLRSLFLCERPGRLWGDSVPPDVTLLKLNSPPSLERRLLTFFLLLPVWNHRKRFSD